MGVERVILGVAYVFAKKNLRKPFHTEVVELHLFPALCENGCGLFYCAPMKHNPEKVRHGEACPTCHKVAPAHKISSERDRVEISVKMTFGNPTDVEFLRAIGPLKVTQTNIHASPAPIVESAGRVIQEEHRQWP